MPRQSEWHFACACGFRFTHGEDAVDCPRCGERLTSEDEAGWAPVLMRIAVVARRLSISSSKAYELIEKGRLEHHRIDGAIRVSDEQLRSYLDETTRGRKAAALPRKANPRPPKKARTGDWF